VDVVGGIQEWALKLDTSECDLGDRNRPWVARFTKFIYDEHLIAMGLCRLYLHPPFLYAAHPYLVIGVQVKAEKVVGHLAKTVAIFPILLPNDKYIQIFLTIGQGNSADLESGTCRFLLIKDKATTGDLIDVGQSYFMNTGPHLMPDKMSINAAKNYNNMRRYSTLLDRQHSVQMFGDTLGSKAATPCMTFYIPINRVFTYKSGSSSWNDAANMVQETIQFALAADEAGCCNVSAYFRVGYKDA